MFNFNIDRKTILIALGIMILFSLITAGTATILDKLLILPGVLIALTFHEFAHAYVADKLGDETPRLQGRLNLNPISHVDPIGFIFLLFAGFGWGKPVQINPRNFNGKYSLSKAEALVAVAGPVMNFIVAFITLIIFYVVFYVTNWYAIMSANVASIVETILMYTARINVSLGVFNLIPLPPLDGSKVLFHFLPANGRQWFYKNEQIFYIVFILLWVTGLASVFLQPIFSFAFSGIDWVVSNLIGLFI